MCWNLNFMVTWQPAMDLMRESKEMTDRQFLCRTCPRCNTDNSEEKALSYSWKSWLLRQCNICRFVYLENPPGYSDFKIDYAWEKNFKDRKTRMRQDHPILYRLSHLWKSLRQLRKKRQDKSLTKVLHSVSPGLVVDIGCGDGSRLRSLPEDYRPVGIEISQTLARKAEATLSSRGGFVINAPAVDGLSEFEANSATGILMRSFLEHEHNPGDLLIQSARVLQPQGVAIIKVPNYSCVNRRVFGSRWCGFRFPGHLNYFTPESLSAMVESTGLTVSSFGFLDRFPFSDNMWMIARK